MTLSSTPPTRRPRARSPATIRRRAPARLPGADLIDRDYDAFLERFKRETGQR